MRAIRLLTLIGVALFLMTAQTIAYAEQSFVINEIRIQGNVRVHIDTVLEYLPVRLGQRLAQQQFADVIEALYQTGFFSNVALARDGDILIIRVTERPVISQVTFTGNKMINKEKVEEIRKEVGLVKGNAFNQAVLDQVEKLLRDVYVEQGRYSTVIQSKVKPLERNRVAIEVIVHEGDEVQVREIRFLGNHAFTAAKLRKQLELTTPKPWSFLTGGDKYNKYKLDKDLQALRDFYQDHGYVQVKVKSGQAILTPDKAWAYLVINIKEGEIYKLKGYRLLGDIARFKPSLEKLMQVQQGSIYQRKQVVAGLRAIQQFLGDRGYALANVQLIPDIDEKAREVFLNIHITPGSPMYVRRIKFVGNTTTSDQVLRRQMRQLEGSLSSTAQVEESLRRLRNLTYIKQVSVKTEAVPNTDDQVDMEINVQEESGTQMFVEASYGTYGMGFGTSIQQANLLGNGQYLGVKFNRDMYRKIYQVNYNEPFYTDTGISRGWSVYSSSTTPGRLNLTSYSYDTLGGQVNFGIPVSENSTVRAGLGIETIDMYLGDAPALELRDFVNKFGNGAVDVQSNRSKASFDHAIVELGWYYSHYDQQPFPTKGFGQSLDVDLSAPISNRPLNYYKADYSAHWYYPLYKSWIASVLGNFGYGQGYGIYRDDFPLIRNYTAGGIPMSGAAGVRGYEQNALGPQDSKGNALGGNVLISGSAQLIFPNPISEDLRTLIFLDAGNVYNSELQSVDLSKVRLGMGLGVEWRLPLLGIIQFSYAKALNPQSYVNPLTGQRFSDKTRSFQFTLGTSL